MKLHLLWGIPLVLAASTSARANLLSNGSLETTSRVNNNGRVLTPTEVADALGSAWSITQGTVDLLPASYWQPSNGNFSVDLIGTPGLGGIAQTVTGLTIGDDYVLTFDFAVNPDPREAGSTKVMQVQAVGNTVLATQTYQKTNGSASRSHMEYTSETFQFTADSTSVTLTLSALAPLNLPSGITPSTSLVGPVIDNLVLLPAGGGAQSPEPASLGVLGIGALALLRRRRR